MKNVECLLSGIKVVERKGAVVTEVSGVESDSRQVKKDNLFVAVRGASVGHKVTYLWHVAYFSALSRSWHATAPLLLAYAS